jgi:hypothetical protein
MLLKLSNEFVEKGENEDMLKYIEQEKYNMNGVNKTYYGGDTKSWQRYTRALPIYGKGSIIGDDTVQFTPMTTLKYNTWYALVLLHNNHEYDDYIYEDYLIPFKTEASEYQAEEEELEGEEGEEEEEGAISSKINQVEKADGDIPDRFLCCVCLENLANLLMIPCNHLITCGKCGADLKDCPNCRTSIISTTAVFLN